MGYENTFSRIFNFSVNFVRLSKCQDKVLHALIIGCFTTNDKTRESDWWYVLDLGLI